MKNLLQPVAQTEIRRRIAMLKPEDTRKWGTLTVEEMMAHVRQAYIYTTSGGEAPQMKMPIPGGILKFFALSMPVKWPKTIQTTPRLQRDAMPVPGTFADERHRLAAAYERFLGFTSNAANHPMFGAMQPADWMRWGYLHADHHLRQFGR